MFQFYFLSVFLNIISGLILVYSSEQKDEDDLMVLEDEAKASGDSDFSSEDLDDITDGMDFDSEGKNASSSNKVKKGFARFFGKGSFTDDAMFYLVIGILGVFTAIIKLLSAVNGIAFLGDFIPAVTGFLGGTAILIKYFQMKSSVALDMNETLEFILVQSRRVIGIACIAAGIIHFVVPGVLFL